jgi:hypothetical protein
VGVGPLFPALGGCQLNLGHGRIIGLGRPWGVITPSKPGSPGGLAASKRI